MTAGIIVFLNARYDEAEQRARAATPGPWWHNPGKAWLAPEAFERYDQSKGEEFVGYGESPFSGCVASTGPASHAQSMADAEHIAHHDPTDTLADLDAKRRILALYEELQDPHLHEAIQHLALPHASHPDYQPEWRPA